MPILDIEMVIRPGETIDPKLAMILANRAGEIFGSPPGYTWVKLHLIPHENYAENGVGSPDMFPVFVSVLKAKLPPRDALQDEVIKLTAAIAQICKRPNENVHILYLPEGAGRIAFGGQLVISDGERPL